MPRTRCGRWMTHALFCDTACHCVIQSVRASGDETVYRTHLNCVLKRERTRRRKKWEQMNERQTYRGLLKEKKKNPENNNDKKSKGKKKKKMESLVHIRVSSCRLYCWSGESANMPPAGERTTRRYGTSSHSKNGEMCVSIQEKKKEKKKEKEKETQHFLFLPE